MQEIKGSEEIIEADLVLLAMGFLGPEQVNFPVKSSFSGLIFSLLNFFHFFLSFAFVECG